MTTSTGGLSTSEIMPDTFTSCVERLEQQRRRRPQGAPQGHN